MKKSIKKKGTLWKWWSLLRLLAVGWVWVNPLVGILVNTLLDTVDGDMFERMGWKRDSYEKWDKWMDLVFLVSIAMYVVWYWQRDVVWYVFMLIFGWRVLGQVLYGLMGQEWLLMVFPNMVTGLFLLKMVTPGLLEMDLVVSAPWPILGVLMVYALFKEWWLHVAKLDISDLVLGGWRWRKRG